MANFSSRLRKSYVSFFYKSLALSLISITTKFKNTALNSRCDVDVLAVTECRFASGVYDLELFARNYIVFCWDRGEHSEFVLHDLPGVESFWIKLSIKSSNFWRVLVIVRHFCFMLKSIFNIISYRSLSLSANRRHARTFRSQTWMLSISMRDNGEPRSDP